MDKIGNILPQHIEDRTNRPHLANEWQAFAYKIWIEYSGVKRELPNLMRFFKQHLTDRPILDLAYNFCIDYTGNIPKLRLFYWEFWRLKRGPPRQNTWSKKQMEAFEADLRGTATRHRDTSGI